MKSSLTNIILGVLFRMAPVALGAIGATVLLVYPEGWHAFCTVR